MRRITEYAGVDFRRSSEGGSSCVEVARVNLVAVRDSKDPEGPVHVYGMTEWADFIRAAKAGEYDFE